MTVHASQVCLHEGLGHVGGILSDEPGVLEDQTTDFLESISLD